MAFFVPVVAGVFLMVVISNLTAEGIGFCVLVGRSILTAEGISICVLVGSELV